MKLKKIFAVAIVVLALAIAVFSLAACNEKETPVDPTTPPGTVDPETPPSTVDPETCEHQYPSFWTIETDATCTTDGLKVKVCTICKVARLTEVIPKTGHNYTDQYQDCLYHVSKCTRCGDSEEPEMHRILDNGKCKYCGWTMPYTKGLEITEIKDQGGNSTGECEVVGWGDNMEATEIIIPSIDPNKGLPVVRIGEKALCGSDHEYYGKQNNLVRIVLPECIRELGEGCFSYNPNLKEVNLPNTITKMDIAVFNMCTGIESVDLPTSIDELPFDTFDGCSSLADITIPDNIKKIANYVFINCSSLKHISMPVVTEIGNYTFDGCDALARVDFRGTLEDWVKINFGGFDENGNRKDATGANPMHVEYYPTNFGGTDDGDDDYYDEEDWYGAYAADDAATIASSGKKVFEAKVYLQNGDCLNDMENVTIPSNITYFGIAFAGSGKLKTISLPSTVTEIGSNAFKGCTALEHITLPAGLLTIGDYAFSESGLVDITIPDSVTSLGAYTFRGCKDLVSVVIGSGVKELSNGYGQTTVGVENGGGMFRYCSNLQTVELKDGLETIGTFAFADCPKLKTVTLPASLKTIKNRAFYKCVLLDDITLNDGLETIDDYAFQHCAKLTSLDFPNSVVSIGVGAFHDCSSLAEVTFEGAIKHIDPSAFQDTKVAMEQENGYNYLGTFLISVEANTLKQMTTISIREGTTIICDGVFANTQGYSYDENGVGTGDGNFTAPNIKGSLTLPSSLVTIGVGAFFGLENLTGTLTIPANVQTIEAAAFAYTGFSSIQFAEGSNLKRIESSGAEAGAFEEMPNLEGEVALPSSLEFLGTAAFLACKKLASVTFGADSQLEEIAGTVYYGAFAFCDLLEKVELPASLKILGSYTFYGDVTLSDVSIPQGVTELGDSAFAYTAILSAEIPAGIANADLGDSVFVNCFSLAEVTLHSNVTSLKGHFFGANHSLTKINFHGTKAQWEALVEASSTLWYIGLGDENVNEAGAGKCVVYIYDGESDEPTENLPAPYEPLPDEWLEEGDEPILPVDPETDPSGNQSGDPNSNQGGNSNGENGDPNSEISE